jgi:hypothetical protein
MSNKNKSDKSQAEKTEKPATDRKPRGESKPFVERQTAKADLIVDRAQDLVKGLDRGVPEPAATRARDFLTAALALREAYQLVQASGWQPAAGGKSAVTIKERDLVSLKADALTTYDYIPTSAKLLVGKAIAAGRSQMFQVFDAEQGTPYGYVHRAHLVLVWSAPEEAAPEASSEAVTTEIAAE